MFQRLVKSTVLVTALLLRSAAAEEVDDFTCVPVETRPIKNANRLRKCRLACKQDIASCVGFYFDKKPKQCTKFVQVSDDSSSTESMFCTPSVGVKDKRSKKKMSCESEVTSTYENFTREQCDFQCVGKERDYMYDSDNKLCITVRNSVRPKSTPKNFCHIVPKFKKQPTPADNDEAAQQGSDGKDENMHPKKCVCFDEGDLSRIETSLQDTEKNNKLSSGSCQRVVEDDGRTSISLKYGPAIAQEAAMPHHSWGYTVYTTDKNAGCLNGDIARVITSHQDAMDCIEMIENTCKGL